MIAVAADGQQFVSDWIKPWGQLFIRFLQLVAVPLVFVSLVRGVIGLGDISQLSKMGLKTIVLYVFTTIIAVLIGVTLAMVIQPGQFFEMTIDEPLIITVSDANAQSNESPLNFIFDLVPSNIFAAIADNSNMIQIIFFALLFGVAALTIEKNDKKPLIKLFDSLYFVILKMVNFVIRLAPYGVFALLTGLVVDTSADLDLFKALAIYALTVIFGLLFIILVIYPILMKLFTKIAYKRFVKEAYPAQLVGFSTSSSSATLPVTMEVATNRLGLPKEVVSFVMPIGATLNMDGTSCFQAVSIIFIAQILGLDLTVGTILTIIFMTTVSSIGAPGIPGGSYVVMTMVLTSIGIPAQGLALLLGIDRPIDMLRTAVNVTGDFVVAAIVAKSDSKYSDNQQVTLNQQNDEPRLNTV
jgi:Na+/H+-dicarboxylate symporter